jgi:hypothetical protein
LCGRIEFALFVAPRPDRRRRVQWWELEAQTIWGEERRGDICFGARAVPDEGVGLVGFPADATRFQF